MKILKVYREHMPSVKLIGKRFQNQDRDEHGTFAAYWQQSFQEGWFDILKECKIIPGISEDYLGMMRALNGMEHFEYWIGAFMAPDSQIPKGFEAADIPEGDVGICWLYGSEKGKELYSEGASNLTMAALKENGMMFSETGWFFERYNCPRFTAPDEQGNVILDIGAYLK